jgi:hypothetical protein
LSENYFRRCPYALIQEEAMLRARYAYWWATPPAILGPLVILIFVGVVTLCGYFAATGRLEQAILTAAVGVFLAVIAVIDMIAEVVRNQKLMLEALDAKK